MSGYYGSFVARSPHEALVRLMRLSLDRIKQNPPPSGVQYVQFPVGILFARGDRSGEGGELAKQAVSSFHYWDDDSGDSIDLIYAGWSENEEQLIFDRKDFLAFRSALERDCRWKYSGGTDLLLLNFQFWPGSSEGFQSEKPCGNFSFNEVIVLPIEAMLREGMIGSIDEFIGQIVIVAKHCSRKEHEENSSPVWLISDKLGMRQGKKELWSFILHVVLRDYSEKLKALGHFAVRDLASEDGTLLLELPDKK